MADISTTYSTEVSNNKNPPKIKKVCEIDTYVCLQQFDNFQIYSACNHRKRKLYKSADINLEKFVKSHQGNLFLAGLSHLKPLCTTSWSSSLSAFSNRIFWKLLRAPIAMLGFILATAILKLVWSRVLSVEDDVRYSLLIRYRLRIFQHILHQTVG